LKCSLKDAVHAAERSEVVAWNRLLANTPQTMDMRTLQLLGPPRFNLEEVIDELIYYLFRLIL
jgi:hypothetical protein